MISPMTLSDIAKPVTVGKCRVAAHLMDDVKDSGTQQCAREDCNNTFTPRNGNQKYCSEDCWYVGVLERTRAKQRKERVCVVCGSRDFEHKRKIYCSKKCAYEAKKEKILARQRRLGNPAQRRKHES